MRHKPGKKVPVTGIYWCSVCKRPASFTKDEGFPPCPNRCGRCLWELVRAAEGAAEGSNPPGLQS